jgi:uncharacterized membrane protein
MDHVLYALTVLSALGTGMMGGLFFAFSTFVMRAPGRLRPTAAIVAMQSINVAILNPTFFALFFGLPFTCVVLATAAGIGWYTARPALLIAGSLLYSVGTFLVTMVCNVPLNNELAAAHPESSDSARVWIRYLARWTAWNHVRTVASVAAAVCFILALG